MAQKSHSPGRTSKPDQDGYTALMRAAETGRVNTVRGLLKRGANVNAQDSFGRTALMVAAALGHVEVVKALLAARADSNLRAFNFHMGDYTALMAGMDSESKHRLEMLDAMIAAGAELNPTGAGRTPLMRAIEKKDIALMEALLKRGAKVNWKNRQGLTPLMAAVVGSSPAIVKFLVDAGADVNARSNDSQTALSLAEEIYNEFKLPAQAEVMRLLTASSLKQ